MLGLAALAATVLIAAVPQQQTPPPLLQNVHRIVCLGDSITEGGEHAGGYVWLIRHYLQHLYPDQHIEVLNAGVSGNRSNDMLARFQRDVLDKQPDLITISCGVNDVWHGFFEHPLGDGPGGIPLPQYRQNIESMINSAQAKGAKVVVLSATVIGEDLSSPENQKAVAYNACLRDLAAKHKATFVDLQQPFRTLITDYRRRTGGRDFLLTGDGVHMVPAGNKVMAHTILTGLGVSPEAQATVNAAVAGDQ